MLPIYMITLSDNTNIVQHQIRQRLIEQLNGRDLRMVKAIDTRTSQSLNNVRRFVDKDAWEKLIKANHRRKRDNHKDLTNGAVGCYLSHVRVWQHILEDSPEMAMVIEEDAWIRDLESFETLSIPPLDSWDILLFGCIDLSRRKRTTPTTWVPVTRFLETHAYLIKKNTILKIKSKMFPVTQQLDWQLSSLIQEGLLKVVTHTGKVISQDRQGGTNIQNLPCSTRIINS